MTGRKILDAILAGERDPKQLAQLRDRRVKAQIKTIEKALEGDYRREHLFALRQALEAYRSYQRMLVDCDAEIEQLLQELPTRVDPQQKPLPAPAKKRKRRDNEAHFDLRTHCYRVLGVDLTAVPGLQALSAHQLVAEVGPDLSKFRHGGAFASWLGLCPHNDVSGGKVLARGTRKVKNQLASALRQSAQTLARDRSYLGDDYRRMRARLGPPAAVTATAHKLARIIYHLVSQGEPYDETVFAREQQRQDQRTRARLQTRARSLGYQLVPLQAPPGSVP